MTSGTIKGSTSNQYIDSKIEWSSTPTNSSNTSKVTAALYYKRNNTGFTTYGTGTFSITIDGSKTSASKTLTITGDAWVKAVEATKTVTHNPDGTKSITISAAGSISGTSLTATYCGDGVTLDTIPRASSISSASAVTLGNKCSVKWTPNANSFRYKIRFSLGDWSYTTGAIHPNTTSAYTYTGYTIPLTVANQITNAKSGTMTATLYTYSNSGATTQVGSAASKTFTVTVPSNSSTVPSVSMNLTPVSSLGSQFSSLYIQGRSKVKASFTGSEAKYEASISSYTMTVNGSNYGSPYQSGWLSQSGTISVKGEAKDSRGYSASVTQNINVIAYSKPSLIPCTGEKTIVCQRCDSEGNLTPSGTYLRIKAGRKYSKVTVNGVQKNFCVIRYRCKPESKTSFSDSDWVTVLERSDTAVDEVDVIIGNAVSSTTTSYTVQIGVDDDISETPSPIEFNIPTDQVTFHLKKGGKGAAFGKYAETDMCLEIADDWDVTGRVYSLGKGKADIPSGADLNNYKEFGVYNIVSSAIAESLLNCPSIQAGTLIVSSSTGSGENSGAWMYILQRYISFDGKYEYYRLMHTGSTENAWSFNKWEARSNRFWTSLGLSDNVSASSENYGRYVNGDCSFRVVNENHVYVAFNCAFTYNGSTVFVNKVAIPEGYRPARNVYSICATGGRSAARVFVTPSGIIGIDWIQVLSSAEATTSSSVKWVDGYIDYWV